MQPRKPRLKRFWDIKRGLNRPSSFLPKREVGVDYDEYMSALKKYTTYGTYTNWAFSPNAEDIHREINSRSSDRIWEIYKESKRVLVNSNTDIYRFAKLLRFSKFLVQSDMYDESVCKAGVIKLGDKEYFGIHFPQINLSQINSTNTNIPILDLYVYITPSGINGFRTTLDYNNSSLIHPHLGSQFGNFCLGESPLRMSLDVLNSGEEITETDADIFWVNLYRTLFQKTQNGQHYYELANINGTVTQQYSDFKKTMFTKPKVLESFLRNTMIAVSKEKLEVTVMENIFIEENREFFTTKSAINKGTKKTELQHNGSKVFFNEERLAEVTHKVIYADATKLYSNIKENIDRFKNEYFTKNTVDKFYDDYKKTIKVSNNNGADGTRENQVLQFQVL